MINRSEPLVRMSHVRLFDHVGPAFFHDIVEQRSDLSVEDAFNLGTIGVIHKLNFKQLTVGVVYNFTFIVDSCLDDPCQVGVTGRQIFHWQGLHFDDLLLLVQDMFSKAEICALGDLRLASRHQLESSIFTDDDPVVVLHTSELFIGVFDLNPRNEISFPILNLFVE